MTKTGTTQDLELQSMPKLEQNKLYFLLPSFVSHGYTSSSTVQSQGSLVSTSLPPSLITQTTSSQDNQCHFTNDQPPFPNFPGKGMESIRVVSNSFI